MGFAPLHEADRAASLVTVALFWTFMSILWLWSYFEACWRDPGSVISELRRMGLASASGSLSVLPPSLAMLPRCPKCDLPKPMRTHHCSDCGRCYFRWDHHCPVIGNCVGLRNMKAFMLFLLYSGVLICFAGVIAVVAARSSDRVPMSTAVIFLVVGVIIALVIGCFGGQYVPEVCVNRTTIERIAGNDPRTFDAGIGSNVRQVFGENWWLWFVPIPPAVNGFAWAEMADLQTQRRDQPSIRTPLHPEEDQDMLAGV
jgi:hypothetical protein